MFDKINQKHLRVGAKSWRPLAPNDPTKRGGINANRGIFVSNFYHHHHQQQQQPPSTPAPVPVPHSEINQASDHHQTLADLTFQHSSDPAVHLASLQPSIHAPSPTHPSPPSHLSGATHSLMTEQAALAQSASIAAEAAAVAAEAASVVAEAELQQALREEALATDAYLDAAVTEGILMRTREDIEEQERALLELQKAQELLSLRESEIRSKEEAFQRLLDGERLRLEEDARLAQEALDRSARESMIKAEAEQQAKVEELERERLEQVRLMEEHDHQIQERQREMLDKQREIEEKERAMHLQLEEEKRRLAEEAKQAVEESIKEQRRLEEEARLEEELTRLRAEDQARTQRAEQIAAAERAKADAKAAVRAQIEEREDALRASHIQQQRRFAIHMASIPSPVIRELNPISYAQAYSSPSVYAYSLPPSPIVPFSPFFVPEDVKHAARAQRKKSETEQKLRDEEQERCEHRLKTAELEAKLKATTEQLAREQEQADRTQREHEIKIREMERRSQESDLKRLEAAREVELKRLELNREAEFKQERQRLTDEQGSEDLVSLQRREIIRRQAEEEIVKRGRAQIARLKAEAGVGQSSSSQSGPSTIHGDDEALAAKKRGAEAAAYFMAKQALAKPLRSRKLSNSQVPPKPSFFPGRQRRASYAETPPLVTHGTHTDPIKASSPGSGFMVFSFDEVPGYAHDVIKEVESSYILDLDPSTTMSYLRETEEGREWLERGERAALQALVKLAKEMKADAIIKLTVQNPVMINPRRVNLSARGLAVTLKFPSPDRDMHQSHAFPYGRPRKDSVGSLYHHPGLASAPVRALHTPALSMKSEPFDISSPKEHYSHLNKRVGDFFTKPSGILRDYSKANHGSATPVWQCQVVPPSVSSKSSSPIIVNRKHREDGVVSSANRSITNSPHQGLPNPPNYVQPTPASLPHTRPTETSSSTDQAKGDSMVPTRVSSASQASTSAKSRVTDQSGAAQDTSRTQDTRGPGSRRSSSRAASESRKSVEGSPRKVGSSSSGPPVLDTHSVREPVTVASRSNDDDHQHSTETESSGSHTLSDEPSALATVASTAASVLRSALASVRQTLEGPTSEASEASLSPRSSLDQSSFRPQSSHSVQESTDEVLRRGVGSMSDRCSPVKKTSQSQPSRSSSRGSSPSGRSSHGRKRYSATQVPLPMTPRVIEESYAEKRSSMRTPRQIPLPDSPTRRESSPVKGGHSHRSVHFSDVWIGDHWDLESPMMMGLMKPLTPKPAVYGERTEEEDLYPLIDMDYEFDQYAVRGSPRSRGTSCWKDLDQLT